MSWLDLHMHSCHSEDAHYLPQELMDLCFAAGVRTAAVADHNSTGGVRAAQKRAAVTGITLIPATELDCTFHDVGLHVLGYWIDPDNATFAVIEENVAAQERQNAKTRIHLVQEYGIFAEEEEIMRRAKNGIVPGELICEVALEDARNRDNPKMQPYLPGGARAGNAPVNFYWDICAQGKPAYVFTEFISLQTAIDTIQSAGGIAVLAHPGNNIHESENLLRGIVAEGVVGLEAFSSYHSTEQTQFYCQKAAEMGLAVTCGSDFHGKTKPNIQIGSIDCEGLETQLLEGLWEKYHLVQG